MEHLSFTVPSKPSTVPRNQTAIAGVVGSGNLEVLLEPGPNPDAALFSIQTAARGFGEVWQAVLSNFAEEYPIGGLQFSINDNAATPAVVALRLRQVLENAEGGVQ